MPGASLRGQLAAQRRHAQHRAGGVLALVALAVARAGERLLHRVHGQHAEGARHAGVEAPRARSRRPPRCRRTRSGRSRRGSPRPGTPRPRSGPTRRRTWRPAAARTRPAPRARSTEPPASANTRVAPVDQAARRAPRRSARHRPRRPSLTGALGLRLGLGLARVAVLDALLVDHLLVERQALVVEQVAEPVLLGRAGSRGCGRPARARSGSGR